MSGRCPSGDMPLMQTGTEGSTFELSIIGWVTMWAEDGELNVQADFCAEREQALDEAYGAELAGAERSMVIPAYDWTALHPLLGYPKGKRLDQRRPW